MAHTRDARLQERREMRRMRQQERDACAVRLLDNLVLTYPIWSKGV